ncbi:50S ribosomal protein L35 [Candidatus Protochlamydia naegleriophila]|uniref:Large ribosomal subunit protein bL35 n=1 Tax=Candidatus Protochlamydia naegleriophila TaxID=389348 RepID=A0A0U5JGP1_9BACT|nr:50S ribosomal protein L35 [Candidatus Protochlamydia naegleriophila]
MPKMKTRKAVASKFRVTATGKLKASRPGRRHKLTGKTPKRKRQLRQPGLVDDGHLKTYKRLMCL